MRNQRATLVRDVGATTTAAAGGGCHQRRAEVAIHGIDQQPGAAVAHAHGPRRRGDRAATVDVLKQVHLAGPQRDFTITHYTGADFQIPIIIAHRYY